MFHHDKHLQYQAKPEKPDPVYAKKLQEILGGQWGEMTVAVQYLFQGWNCRAPDKYRDMIMDIGTEELAHVEMLATMIARLLESAPVEDQEAGARDGLVAAAMGGDSMRDALVAGAMNPMHTVYSGMGATPTDSVGYPWNSRYTISSGNLLADFRSNLTAESQGRLQACRLYELTEDRGVRDMLGYLIARDHMHQNQWLAAIQELEAEGLDKTPVPSDFPLEQEHSKVAYQFMSCSADGASREGRWAQGDAPDGGGRFEFLEMPPPEAEVPHPGPVTVHMHSTGR